MITHSDWDGKKTYKGAVLGNLGMLGALGGMAYTGMLVPLFVPFAVGYCFNHTLDALRGFKNFPNSLTGMRLTVASYRAIAGFFACIAASITYRVMIRWMKKIRERTDKEKKVFTEYLP